MANTFKTGLVKKHSSNFARSVKVTTPHGEFVTPCFMPVGTRAFVNLMSPQDLTTSGSQIILGGNTYHMLCSPGLEIIESLGGMHKMMNWNKPMLTDSGGFQVLSLSKNSEICKIKDDGAHFKHPVTGKIVRMTPQSSIEAQKIIGADIIMAFDQCTADDITEAAAKIIMDKTHRWLLESKEVFEKNTNSAYGLKQALFGIIQGSCFENLRKQSAEFIVKANCDGIAIGGESVGFDMKKTAEIINWIRDILPDEKVRYTMGVGLHPQDLIDVVELGIDIFDCVAPTRNARHGTLYHSFAVKNNDWVKLENYSEASGKLIIKKSMYAKDDRPILENCTCTTCKNYSRGYLHFLFKSNSPAYHALACTHNIHVMHQTCDVMREQINAVSGSY